MLLKWKFAAIFSDLLDWLFSVEKLLQAMLNSSSLRIIKTSY